MNIWVKAGWNATSGGATKVSVGALMIFNDKWRQVTPISEDERSNCFSVVTSASSSLRIGVEKRDASPTTECGLLLSTPK